VINCTVKLNGQEVKALLALPITRMAENPSEVYYDDLRIEIDGLGVLRIPLSKVNEVLSLIQSKIAYQKFPPSARTRPTESPYKKPEPEAQSAASDNVSDMEVFRRRKAK
jgi:hypothetical protein